MFMFLSSHGSSLIGLPFSPLGCLPVVFVYVTCAVFWLHRRVQRSNSWWRVQNFVANPVLGDFVRSFFVNRRGDGRVLVVCHFLVRC